MSRENTLSIADIDDFCQQGENEKNEQKIKKLGGIDGLRRILGSNFEKGLASNAEDLALRREKYGRNEFPSPEEEGWWSMFFESFQDATLGLLIGAAFVSLGVGIYEDMSKGGIDKGWIEGAAILFAVTLVAVVTATNNYSKESQFRKLNAQKDDVDVALLRDGKRIEINVKEIVVGDVVVLDAGVRVPADGLFIEGSDVACDESSFTGEPRNAEKTPVGAKQVGSKKPDPFLISGTNVASGSCTMLVTAVGENSRWGKTKAKLAAETVDTPLQEKLDVLATQIGHLGMGVAGATFAAMLAIWWYYPETRGDRSLFDQGLKAFIMAVTIVVVAVPEGLPLAVTLSLAYSTQKMMLDNNLIRVLAACETMGNATNICSDKTGTLTRNQMTVVEGWIAGKSSGNIAELTSSNPKLIALLTVQCACNSTAALIKNPVPNLPPIVSGSKTEGALLIMIEECFGKDSAAERAQGYKPSRGDKLFTFTSARKKMSVLLKSEKGNGGVVYTKGAAEVILASSNYYTNERGEQTALDARTRKSINDAINTMAKGSRRTIALAHRELAPISGEETYEEVEQNLCIDAIFGIDDPLRPEVVEAVAKCQDAGIMVRMVTGDNIDTAKAIATECGIYTEAEGGLAVEGPDFRKYTPAKLDSILPRLQVLARSSPEDKYKLVTRLNGNNLPKDEEAWLKDHPGRDWLKERDLLLPGYREEWEMSRLNGVGEVVGVTGDGTNDGPALKAADVGLSMGLSGTDVAKEASDIVILDDNFASIVKAVMWGRSVFDNIRKFLQFQLTVNVVALTITFMSAVNGMEPPLNAVMMLWVNLIMDTMGALALGTEPPSSSLLTRRPYRRDASLISNVMIRNITVQSVYQILLLVYLLFLGYEDFKVEKQSSEHFTIIFNTFVICQIFNEFNARSIGDDFDVFRGLHRNPIFICIILFTCASQYALVQYGGAWVKTTPLDADQWFKCVLLGALSLTLGGFMRLLPIKENEMDLAPLPALVKANQDHAMQSANGKHDGRKALQSAFSLSFLLWLGVIGAVPAYVYMEFGQDWQKHIEQRQPMTQVWLLCVTFFSAAWRLGMKALKLKQK